MYVTRKLFVVCRWCALLCSYFPPLIAVFLILANVGPYYFVFLPRLHESFVKGDASLLYCVYCRVVMTVAVVLVFVSFFLAVCTPPGYVDRSLWADAPVCGERPRYCVKCEIYKPDDAHHCRTCRRCVHYMDHHCPWINNCVGRDNTKYFLLFLLYIPLGAFHISATTAYSCVYQFRMQSTSDWMFGGAHFFSILFSFAMGVSFFFLGAHFASMAFRAETSVGKKARGGGEDARLSAEGRAKYMDDIFGHDRRWWRMVLPVPVVRGGRTDPRDLEIV